MMATSVYDDVALLTCCQPLHNNGGPPRRPGRADACAPFSKGGGGAEVGSGENRLRWLRVATAGGVCSGDAHASLASCGSRGRKGSPAACGKTAASLTRRGPAKAGLLRSKSRCTQLGLLPGKRASGARPSPPRAEPPGAAGGAPHSCAG